MAATIAAAKYLKTLSTMFGGDWSLVLAAACLFAAWLVFDLATGEAVAHMRAGGRRRATADALHLAAALVAVYGYGYRLDRVDRSSVHGRSTQGDVTSTPAA